MTSVRVAGGVGVLDGHVVRWEDSTLVVEPNRAWFYPRVDLVVLGPVGLSILKGKPAFWSRVPPECPAGRLPILVYTVPSGIRSVLGVVRDRYRG